MNSGELLIFLALALPLFAAAVIYAVGRMPDVRETLTLVACIALCDRHHLDVPARRRGRSAGDDAWRSRWRGWRSRSGWSRWARCSP